MNPEDSVKPSADWEQRWSRMERLVQETCPRVLGEPEGDLTGDLPERFDAVVKVAEGGMGEVYRATDRTLDRQVALKAVRRDLRLSPEARERLLEEARVLSALEHPHICRIHDYLHGQARDYLVLEWVEGRGLDQAIWSGEVGPKSDQLASQIVEALSAAHAEGVTHRDLKPQNIMVTEDGSVRLMDFGIARGLAQSDGDPSSSSASVPGDRTLPGTLLGTVRAMAPEQARGERADARSDVFALGLVLQELWSEQPARPAEFSLDDAERGLRLGAEGLDGGRAQLVAACCSLDPATRPTAEQVRLRLRWIQGRRLRRRWAGFGFGLLLIGLMVAVKYTIDVTRARDRARVARTEAEFRRDLAEGLVVFLVEDLREQLEGVNRTDLLAGVGTKVVEYFEAVPPEQLSKLEREVRARAFYQLGQVHFSMGDLTQAYAHFQSSKVYGEELVSGQEADPERLFDLAQAQFYLGYVHYERRELESARSFFEAYLASARQGLVLDPGDRRWSLEERYALSTLGSLLREEGDLPGAQTQFLKLSEAWERQCSGTEVSDTDLEEWADALSLAASVASALDQTEKSVEGYLREIEVRDRLKTESMEARHRRAIAHNNLAGLLYVTGTIHAAVEHSRRAGVLLGRLVEHDPQNTLWLRSLGAQSSSLGRLLIAMGEQPEGLEAIRRARDIFDDLVDRDPTHREWRTEQITCYEVLLGALSGVEADSVAERLDQLRLELE